MRVRAILAALALVAAPAFAAPTVAYADGIERPRQPQRQRVRRPPPPRPVAPVPPRARGRDRPGDGHAFQLVFQWRRRWRGYRRRQLLLQQHCHNSRWFGVRFGVCLRICPFQCA